jgi:amidohydrolase
MPVVNRIAAYAEEMQGWRRHLHAHPELSFDCHETAGFVAARLREFGVDELHEGIATSGIVAIIEGQGEGPVIGLRADMDALPITEATGAEHASTTPGKMHACGHDGHTTMLLGAAKYLAETRNFAGKVALIFQPAEENGGGAGVMCEEGIMDRFGIGSVYALHNVPGLEEGQILTTPGPIMAAVDTFEVHITGVGGHGAMPHETADPIPPAIAIAQAMPTIVSRNNYALDDLVISVTQIHAGTVDNVIPATAFVNGTVRTFDATVQDMVERRMGEIVAGHAAAFGVKARLDYLPRLSRHDQRPGGHRLRRRCRRLGRGCGEGRRTPAARWGRRISPTCCRNAPAPTCSSARGRARGCTIPEFDFNDDIAPIGASIFARLVEVAQPA